MPRIAILALASILAVAADSPLDPAAIAAAAPAAGPRHALVTGTFTLPSQVRDNPEVTVRWATPADVEGRPAPRRADILCYFTYPNESGFADGPMFKRLVGECGFTAFGIFFAKQAQSDGMVPSDRGCYLWAESGSFACYRAALDEVRRRASLLPGAVLAYGDSGGGTAAQHFAEEYPDLVDGVACLAGQAFVERRHSRAAFLILNTVGDTTVEDGDGLVRYARLQGTSYLRQLTQPIWKLRRQPRALFAHCMDDRARDLSCAFLGAIADLRLANGGAVPAMRDWPYAASTAHPEWIEAGASTAIPETDLARLPSAACYAAWIHTPPPTATLAVGGWHEIRIAMPAPVTTPSAVVLYAWPRGEGAALSGLPPGTLHPEVEVAWDLRYLADRGVVAIGLPGGFARAGEALAELRHRHPELPALPVWAIHRAPAPGDLAAAWAIPGLAGRVAVIDATAPVRDWAADLTVPPGVSGRTVLVLPTATAARVNAGGLQASPPAGATCVAIETRGRNGEALHPNRVHQDILERCLAEAGVPATPAERKPVAWKPPAVIAPDQAVAALQQALDRLAGTTDPRQRLDGLVELAGLLRATAGGGGAAPLALRRALEMARTTLAALPATAHDATTEAAVVSLVVACAPNDGAWLRVGDLASVRATLQAQAALLRQAGTWADKGRPAAREAVRRQAIATCWIAAARRRQPAWMSEVQATCKVPAAEVLAGLRQAQATCLDPEALPGLAELVATLQAPARRAAPRR